jgi:hypothetical protein
MYAQYRVNSWALEWVTDQQEYPWGISNSNIDEAPQGSSGIGAITWSDKNGC